VLVEVQSIGACHFLIGALNELVFAVDVDVDNDDDDIVVVFWCGHIP
jgi:hypothetical protein